MGKGKRKREKREVRSEACDFLLELLSDGPDLRTAILDLSPSVGWRGGRKQPQCTYRICKDFLESWVAAEKGASKDLETGLRNKAEGLEFVKNLMRDVLFGSKDEALQKKYAELCEPKLTDAEHREMVDRIAARKEEDAEKTTPQ
ncbi:unnamed protein product, partial [Symbiodinium natans]